MNISEHCLKYNCGISDQKIHRTQLIMYRFSYTVHSFHNMIHSFVYIILKYDNLIYVYRAHSLYVLLTRLFISNTRILEHAYLYIHTRQNFLRSQTMALTITSLYMVHSFLHTISSTLSTSVHK